MVLRAVRMAVGLVAGLAVVVALALPARAQFKGTIKIGNFCDRLGPTQTVGVKYCQGFHDYFDLVNSKGGIEGLKVEHLEIEHGYAFKNAGGDRSH